MGKAPKIEKAEAKRIKVNWSNIHIGTGVKLLKAMVLEVDEAIYNSLKDISKEIAGNDIDAIKLVDNKTTITHELAIEVDKNVVRKLQ